MSHDIRVIHPSASFPSLAREVEPTEPPLRIAVVQTAWLPVEADMLAWLDAAVDAAAAAGARIAFMPELTLTRFPGAEPPVGEGSDDAEDLLTGPTMHFAAAAAKRTGIFIHVSLFRKSDAGDGLGLNTAIVVDPAGNVVAATDKLHIPVAEGYYEDRYFRPGSAEGNPYPVHELKGLAGARFGLPTCWDQWFPEVARAYSLGGANVVVYPTAIGPESDYPELDTEPLWRQVIVGNGIANGLFMVVPNRTGSEGGNEFYGSSFVSDPYGRVLVQAPRDEACVLVADLDLAQREDWLDLFPLLATRRPDTYGTLLDPLP